MAKQEDLFKNVVSHAKEYGFIFPSSEIYDGKINPYSFACETTFLNKSSCFAIVLQKYKK